MKRSLLAATGAAFVLLALSACSSSAPAPSPTAATVTKAPAAESTGTTLVELRRLYASVGGECQNPQRRAASAVAEDSADCENGALISVYASQAQRDEAIAVLQGLQESNPSPHVIAVGPDWTVNGDDAGSLATAMGGEAVQIGEPVAAVEPVAPALDLTTDAGVCAADAELTNLELNDALAPVLGYPADRDRRTPEQDDAIREHKAAAFERACPERVF